MDALAGPANEAAPLLLGSILEVGPCRGRIVEVEAYEQFDDEASHSFRGPTQRNAAMFGKPGTLYVYRIYGMHWCANVVCGPVDHGAAVLIRALEPLDGIKQMAVRRGRDPSQVTDLCSGPGKLCQALGIDGDSNGADLFSPTSNIRLEMSDAVPQTIDHGPRIGISRSIDLPWRFGHRGSPHLSRRLQEQIER